MIHNIQQRTHAWHMLRLGKLTGSKIKGVFSANNLAVIDQLIAEEISQTYDDEFVSSKMQRGIDLEPMARTEYQNLTGMNLIEVGFITSDQHPWIGCSPDGVTPDLTHAVEIKCPDTKTHVGYIRSKQLPKEYYYQAITYFLAIEPLQSLAFTSFDPRFTIRPLHYIIIDRKQMNLSAILPPLLKFREKWLQYYHQICF
jgi:putative phage-type endonuclease